MSKKIVWNAEFTTTINDSSYFVSRVSRAQYEAREDDFNGPVIGTFDKLSDAQNACVKHARGEATVTLDVTEGGGEA